jgi:hypothetical protein
MPPLPRHDRDSLFTAAFRETLAAADVARSQNLNAYAERFVRTIKESCLDRLILVGEGSLRRAISEFIEHYHGERNHQGLANRLIAPIAAQASPDGRVLSRERARAAESADRRTIIDAWRVLQTAVRRWTKWTLPGCRAQAGKLCLSIWCLQRPADVGSITPRALWRWA